MFVYGSWLSAEPANMAVSDVIDITIPKTMMRLSLRYAEDRLQHIHEWMHAYTISL